MLAGSDIQRRKSLNLFFFLEDFLEVFLDFGFFMIK
jgi:hypothetical protein